MPAPSDPDMPDNSSLSSISTQLAGRHLSSPAVQGGGGAADHQPLQLLPGQWLVLHVPLPARCIGLLQVDRLTLRLSSSCSVAYQLSSFPCGLSGVLGGGPYPKGICPFPTGGGVRPGVCAAMVGHVGPLPKLEVGGVGPGWINTHLAFDFLTKGLLSFLAFPKIWLEIIAMAGLKTP